MAHPETEIFELRDATLDDIPALAALHVATFRETHGRWPGGPDVRLRETQWRSIFQANRPSFCLVIQSEARLIGFARGIDRQEVELPEFKGELNKIYLLREVQGLGLGRRLLLASAEEFLKRNITSVILFGDAKSKSNGFYEHMGGERQFAPNGDFHGAYGWRDLATSLCSSDMGQASGSR